MKTTMNLTRLLSIVVLALPVALVGCADNDWDSTQRKGGPLSPPDDVFRLVCAYRPPIWKNYHPTLSDRIEGFKFNLYLVSRNTNKGIHTQGTLQTRLYTRIKQDDGTYLRTQAFSWTQNLVDTPCTTREYQLGWAYQPHYYWGDLDLHGQEIEIVVFYEPPTGPPIYAQPRIQRVPSR